MPRPAPIVLRPFHCVQKYADFIMNTEAYYFWLGFDSVWLVMIIRVFVSVCCVREWCSLIKRGQWNKEKNAVRGSRARRSISAWLEDGRRMYYTETEMSLITSSNGNIFRVTYLLWGETAVDSPRKDQRRGTFTFSLISAWTNGWINHRDPGELTSLERIILMKVSSLAALEVVKMTTSNAASDGNSIDMTPVPFKCKALRRDRINGRHFADDIFEII